MSSYSAGNNRVPRTGGPARGGGGGGAGYFDTKKGEVNELRNVCPAQVVVHLASASFLCLCVAWFNTASAKSEQRERWQTQTRRDQESHCVHDAGNRCVQVIQ